MHQAAFGHYDRVELFDGSVLRVHAGDTCQGPCPFHRPSVHALAAAPMAYLDSINAIFRICPHGIVHPDPDSMRYLVTRRHGYGIDRWHPCCSLVCCRGSIRPLL